MRQIENDDVIQEQMVKGEINKKLDDLLKNLEEGYNHDKKKVAKIESDVQKDTDTDATWTQYEFNLDIKSIDFKFSNEFDQEIFKMSLVELDAKYTMSVEEMVVQLELSDIEVEDRWSKSLK